MLTPALAAAAVSPREPLVTVALVDAAPALTVKLLVPVENLYTPLEE
jgi:hypothetical protein